MESRMDGRALIVWQANKENASIAKKPRGKKKRFIHLYPGYMVQAHLKYWLIVFIAAIFFIATIVFIATLRDLYGEFIQWSHPCL